VLIAALSLGCSGAWVEAVVEVEPEAGAVQVELLPSGPPCPRLEPDATVRVGDVEGTVSFLGGRETDSGDVVYDSCDTARADVAGLPLDGGPLAVELDSGGDRFVLEAPWPAEVGIWTEDDLAAAMAGGSIFEVRWTPAEMEAPAVDVRAETGEPLPRALELVSAEPGRARFRFLSDEAGDGWRVHAISSYEIEGTRCEGVGTCRFRTTLRRRLWPDDG